MAHLCVFLLTLGVATSATAWNWAGEDTEGSIRERFEFYGDTRFRYEINDRTGRELGHRGLGRLRLGSNIDITDRVDAGFALRTGNNRRNGDVIFGGAENQISWDFTVSAAYVDFEPPAPVEGLAIRLGRQPVILKQDPIYSQLLWDEDVYLDGFQLTNECGCEDEDITYGGTVGGYLVGNGGGGSGTGLDDPADENARMLLSQIYGTWGFADNFFLMKALGFYYLANVDETNLNATVMGSPKIIHPVASIGWKNEDGYGLTLAGQYFNNLDADQDEDGFSAGANVHIPFCNGTRFYYQYAMTGAWSTIAPFANDDIPNANMGFDGHVAGVELGMTERTSMGFETYHGKPENGGDTDSRYRFTLGYRF